MTTTLTHTMIGMVIATTVAETPEGAPAGLLYAGLMGHTDLSGFDAAVAALSQAGLVDRRGDVLRATPRLMAMVTGR